MFFIEIENLVKTDRIMTADVYINITHENLGKSLLKLELEDNFIFQQENDPQHTAKKVKFFIKLNNSNNFAVSHFNPIENL